MEDLPLDLSKTTSVHNQSLLNDSGLGSAEQSYDWTEITDQPLDLSAKKGFDLVSELSCQREQTLKSISSLPDILPPTKEKTCPQAFSSHLQSAQTMVQTDATYRNTTPKTAHCNQTENSSLWKLPNTGEPTLSMGSTLKRPTISSAMSKPVPLAHHLSSLSSAQAHGIYTGSNAHSKGFSSGSLARAEMLGDFNYRNNASMVREHPADMNRVDLLDTSTAASQNSYLGSTSSMSDVQGPPSLPYYDNRSAMQYPPMEMCHDDLIPGSDLGCNFLKVPFTKVDGVFGAPTDGIRSVGATEMLHRSPDNKGLPGSRLKTSLHYVNPFNRKNLNFVATKVLQEWFASHIDYPYPTNEEVHFLARAGTVTEVQVRKWLANRRLRTGNTFKYAYSRKRHQFGALKQSGHAYLPSGMSSTSFTGNEAQTWASQGAFRREHDDDEASILQVLPHDL